MIKSIKMHIWTMLNHLGVGGSLQLILDSDLIKQGWFRSYHAKRSVNALGEPLPWYSYAFIAFIEPRIAPHFDVFEYGSGNSTRWYGARVRSVRAVENDGEWVKLISPTLPVNSEVLVRPLGDQYIQSIGEQPEKRYHIIVVDGRNRVRCTDFASDFLTEDGVLILDNSERPFYQKAKDMMRERGFRQLDFYGMAPIVSHQICSTVFYRDGNCLGI